MSVTDPALIKQVFTAPADVVHGADHAPLEKTLGKHSSFALDEAPHLRQRRLLLPPFHGERLAGYAAIFEEETSARSRRGPLGRDFRTLEPMMRITLNRDSAHRVRGRGSEFDELRAFLPAGSSSARS